MPQSKMKVDILKSEEEEVLSVAPEPHDTSTDEVYDL